MIDKKGLNDAVIATFANRKTGYSDNHILFTDDFFLDVERNRLWNGFLEKIKFKDKSLSFADVGKLIQEKMKICCESLRTNQQ